MKPYPDADEIYKNIGRRIREERIKRSWTQEFLAERAGLHLSFVGQVERGLKKPSLRTLKILALVFEIKAGELLDESSRRAPAYPLVPKNDSNLSWNHDGASSSGRKTGRRDTARGFSGGAHLA